MYLINNINIGIIVKLKIKLNNNLPAKNKSDVH